MMETDCCQHMIQMLQVPTVPPFGSMGLESDNSSKNIAFVGKRLPCRYHNCMYGRTELVFKENAHWT